MPEQLAGVHKCGGRNQDCILISNYTDTAKKFSQRNEESENGSFLP